MIRLTRFTSWIFFLWALCLAAAVALAAQWLWNCAKGVTDQRGRTSDGCGESPGPCADVRPRLGDRTGCRHDRQVPQEPTAPDVRAVRGDVRAAGPGAEVLR
jgi:hypothetical protein